MFRCAVQQIGSHAVALMASDRSGEIGWSNKIRHGTNRGRQSGSPYFQESLGPATRAVGLLEISRRFFFGFSQELEIEDGETCVFMHARQLTEDHRENDLPPYWVGCLKVQRRRKLSWQLSFFFCKLSAREGTGPTKP